MDEEKIRQQFTFRNALLGLGSSLAAILLACFLAFVAPDLLQSIGEHLAEAYRIAEWFYGRLPYELLELQSR